MSLDPPGRMRVLHPAPGVVAFYDGRVEGYRHAPGPNWVDEGALSLGIASYAIVDGDEAIVYDTHVSLAHAAFIRDWLQGQGVRRITVVLSHHHLDHVAGTEAFGAVPVIANVRTAAHMARDRVGIEAGTRAPAIRPFVLPTETFDGRRVLSVGRRRVELITANIHSDDQTLIWLPDAGVLLAGDALEDTVTYVTDAPAFADHLHDLARLEALSPGRILPNHGDPDRIAEGGYDPALIGATTRYVEFLMRCQRDPALAARPLEEVIAPDLASGTLIWFAPYAGVHAENLAESLAAAGAGA
jgi:glyoxylase-like metal-dependent hydrolase (beta-lactamase superfamily II)